MTQQTAVEKPRTGFPGAQPGADAGAHRVTDQLAAIKAVSRAISESNALENATEAVSGMPATRRRISVQISDRGGELVFRVCDWGPGIARERVANVFKSGFSTKSEHVGLGLGLGRSIVTRAGGRIEIEQPRGDRVTIAVRIPS